MASLESLDESLNRKLKRQKHILKLREAGLTYKEIAKNLNISDSRVQQIAKGEYVKKFKYAGDLSGLPIVAIHCLKSIEANNLKEVIYYIKKGVLNPRSKSRPPGYGKKIHETVLNWVSEKQGEE